MLLVLYGSAMVQKLLDELVRDGTLTLQEYGKARIYYANQVHCCTLLFCFSGDYPAHGSFVGLYQSNRRVSPTDHEGRLPEPAGWPRLVGPIPHARLMCLLLCLWGSLLVPVLKLSVLFCAVRMPCRTGLAMPLLTRCEHWTKKPRPSPRSSRLCPSRCGRVYFDSILDGVASFFGQVTQAGHVLLQKGCGDS